MPSAEIAPKALKDKVATLGKKILAAFHVFKSIFP